MDKEFIKKIVVNNFIFLVIEGIFLFLTAKGFFDFLEISNSGLAMIPDINLIFISQFFTLFFSGIWAFSHRLSGSYKVLFKYYILSFISLILFLSYMFTSLSIKPIFFLFGILTFLLLSLLLAFLSRKIEGN